jgi:hypothetical protein
MNAGTLIAAGPTVAAVALAAQAQQPTAGAARPGSTARPATANAPAQPALSALVAPRASELADAGVQKITARTGKDIRDIQAPTQYGPAYCAWPKNVTPVLFEIAVGTGNAITVTANDYSEANNARYVAAFDAVIPRALAQASNLRTPALRPRPWRAGRGRLPCRHRPRRRAFIAASIRNCRGNAWKASTGSRTRSITKTPTAWGWSITRTT